MRIWRYWDIPEQGHHDAPDPCATYRSLFADSVRLRLRSDVPVGVFLSGGLDSTAIICEMKRIRNQLQSAASLCAFSFMHEMYDESGFISDTIAQVEADLTRASTTPMHFWNSLPKVLWHHDEPVHSMTAVIGYELRANR